MPGDGPGLLEGLDRADPPVTIGVVSRLWRYPVKSMRGEARRSLEIDARGIVGDRAFALRAGDGRLGSGKTTERFRQLDGLLDLRATYRDGVPAIACPDGRELRGDDADVGRVLSGILGHGVALVREDAVPHLDNAPVHLVTTASLAWLRARLPGAAIDERRFRPNLVIDAPGDGRVEDGWLGRTVSIGREVRLRIVERTERCRMTTLAQDDLPADARVLRRLGRDAELRLGVYAEVVAGGTIACGDAVLAWRGEAGR